ncbi:hypothetical protein Nepgr_026083 [Nepenthes gracilis]|uniref:Heme-binding protein 2 n=1 Tax=Nepenthes gracilis TaxID=150966 RepID=A0AAD3Y1Q6_NEPGR|nr:hypothetical protein Nepgr_026083 [Nepenthes gracilis]
MKTVDLFKLTLVVSLFLGRLWGGGAAVPPPCSKIECPTYTVVYVGNGFEIRRYDSLWMSTSTIQGFSFLAGTQTGFTQLFNYIQGDNNEKKKIEMTAPVLTQITPSDGPFCESSFVVSFYVPEANQANPPLAKGLHTQNWVHKYAAVRQFGGFASDIGVAMEAAALETSLTGSSWYNVIKKSRNGTSVYTVAQYNSPFDFFNRINEILFIFDM